MRWALTLFLILHGLVHLIGAAKAFGLADPPQLVDPIARDVGLLWLAAALGMILTAALYLRSSRVWWVVALMAISFSQALVFSSWPDAKFGTLANVIVLAMAVYGFASRGPVSLRARYRRSVGARLGAPPREILTQRDVADLPEPVRRYLRRTGAVGQPRVQRFYVLQRGRIRAGPDEPWMEFTAEQHDFVDPFERFFFMDAQRGGLPVDVLHAYDRTGAEMTVRLLSLFPLAHASGAEMTRAETVTILNDIAVFAPGALVGPAIRWTSTGPRSARAELTIGPNTVSADLFFDERDELVEFVSDDRLATTSGGTFTRQRWSTPLWAYRGFGPSTIASRGEGRWYPPGRDDYAYIELEVLDLEVNQARE